MNVLFHHIRHCINLSIFWGEQTEIERHLRITSGEMCCSRWDLDLKQKMCLQNPRAQMLALLPPSFLLWKWSLQIYEWNRTGSICIADLLKQSYRKFLKVDLKIPLKGLSSKVLETLASCPTEKGFVFLLLLSALVGSLLLSTVSPHYCKLFACWMLFITLRTAGVYQPHSYFLPGYEARDLEFGSDLLQQEQRERRRENVGEKKEK